VARLGKEAFLSAGAVLPDDLVPLYLRLSYAEEKRKEHGRHAP
jgi:hypothetical protein